MTFACLLHYVQKVKLTCNFCSELLSCSCSQLPSEKDIHERADDQRTKYGARHCQIEMDGN